MFNKKLIVILVITAFIGGVFGSITAANWAKANVFEQLYEKLIKPIIPSTPQDGQTILKQGEISEKYVSGVDYEEAMIKAVEKASPAVVSIIISKNVPIVEQCPYNPFSDLPFDFQQFFGQGFQLYQPCQKGTKLQEVGGGSGFIISKDGLVLTNKHVVYDKDAVYTVMANDGKKYDAKVLAQSPTLDLAVVKVEASDFPIITLGDSDGLRLGQTAIAIGNALGEFRNTVSVGIVSGLARTITAFGAGFGTEEIENVIQTTAAINQGNSGGPLLNLKGEVIGINVAMVSGAQNIAFAIPINHAKKAIESVQKTGKILTPYLGVRYVLVSQELAKKEKLSVEEGALIRGSSDGPAVIKNSPAEKSGVKAEDIVLKINGEKIDQNHPLVKLIQKYSVGDTVKLKILRDNKEIEISVKLEERP